MKISMSKKEKKKLMRELEIQENEAEIMLQLLENCKEGSKEGKHAS